MIIIIKAKKHEWHIDLSTIFKPKEDLVGTMANIDVFEPGDFITLYGTLLQVSKIEGDQLYGYRGICIKVRYAIKKFLYLCHK